MCRKLLTYFAFIAGIITPVVAQKMDSLKEIRSFTASAGLTTNGISLVPTFSLNKPAALFRMSMAKNRFSFDPEFNFSLAAKPWYILFWFRYKVIAKEKLKVNLVTHLGLNCRNVELMTNSVPDEVTVTDRYWAAELPIDYFIAKNVSIGIYYLQSHGLEAGTVGMLNFLTLNAN